MQNIKTKTRDTGHQTFRGQAAMEYLMTYGWAILILGIVIVLLFSTGIFSPSYLISEECNLGPKLPCKFILYQGSTETRIALNITNGFGYKIALSDINITLNENNQQFSLSTREARIESGSEVSIEGSLNAASAKNAIRKTKVDILYFSCAPEVNPGCDKLQAQNSGLMHPISGRIIGRVN